MKYDMLVKILDTLASNAPQENKRYYNTENDIEKQNQIRSRTMVHLFLMVMFGVEDFKTREGLITDDSNDAGIDAYYINSDSKTIYFIQSKFRANEQNFEMKNITSDEILAMEIGRVINGEKQDINGNNYNGKILGMQRKISETKELGLYKYKVILLCNIGNYDNEKIRKLVDNMEFEIFDYQKTYRKLVFPLLISKYFDPASLDLTIYLAKKTNPHLKQEICTSYGDYDITVVFVPTYEIARAMAKYKNALLEHNPRNYLSMSKNAVNEEIRKSIMETDTGEFAIFNNGITIYAESCGINSSSGRKNEGAVTITRPQIINGGQTAFTLSVLFETQVPKERFDNKEVMLKIVTPCEQWAESDGATDSEIILKISKATNQQSQIEEADMRANEKINIDIQHILFEKYGVLYERKKGEFENAIRSNYITKAQVISRNSFVKAYYSYKGYPGQAKNAPLKELFEAIQFNSIIDSIDNVDKMYLSYSILSHLNELEKMNKKHTDVFRYGNVFRYGKNALIYMYSLRYDDTFDEEKITQNIQALLREWPDFERFVEQKNQLEDFANYYRSAMLSMDIEEYVSNSDKRN